MARRGDGRLTPRSGARFRGLARAKDHRDTTMIYTHVLNRGPAAVTSPADRVLDL